MIEIKNLHKKFNDKIALNGINLKIKQGIVLGILGPNGSGKTTLIKSILNIVIPDCGTIKIMGSKTLNNSNYLKNIGYLSQSAEFPQNLKVYQLFELMKSIRSQPNDQKYFIEIFRLNEFLHKKLNSLSGGTKQKINISLAFLFDPQIIILDEPTSGLDPISQIHLKKIIQREKEKGKTILVTSHIMSFIEEISDDILFLLEGSIFFKGKIDDMKSKSITKEKSDNFITDFEKAIINILKNKND